MLKEAQNKLIELSGKYEALKEEMRVIKELMTAQMEIIGENNYFQDPNNKVVYRIIKPRGTFVNFDHLSYVRTRKVGELKGSLSIKEAQERGFVVAK